MSLTQNESYLSGPQNCIWTKLIVKNCGIFVAKKLYCILLIFCTLFGRGLHVKNFWGMFGLRFAFTNSGLDLVC